MRSKEQVQVSCDGHQMSLVGGAGARGRDPLSHVGGRMGPGGSVQ